MIHLSQTLYSHSVQFTVIHACWIDCHLWYFVMHIKVNWSLLRMLSSGSCFSEIWRWKGEGQSGAAVSLNEYQVQQLSIICFLFPCRTKTPTWTRPSTRSRKPSWSSESSFASYKVRNSSSSSRNWLSSRQPSRLLPHSRARRPAAKSNPNAPSPPWLLLPPTRPLQPTEKRPRILQSPRQAKTEETPTCEITDISLTSLALVSCPCSLTLSSGDCRAH